MNKIILFSIAGLTVLGGLIWLARPQAQSNMNFSNNSGAISLPADNSGRLIALEANNYDFGSISMRQGTVKTAFTIKNTATEPVTIKKIYTSCMCTEATLALAEKQFGPFGMIGHGTAVPVINQVIGPNQEAKIAVAFDPAAHGPAGVGRIQRSVIIENSAGRPLELLIAALVKP